MKIKEAAELVGLSVRALHHYDEIGLLEPSRTTSGYREYDDAAIARLVQIQIGRELGLSLEQIRRSLDEPGFDRGAALREQRRQLEERRASITRTLALIQKEETMSYEAETKERWGGTAEYAESQARTKGYTAADWERMHAEQNAIYAEAARLMATGATPASAEAMAVAERHRESIDRWFYPCSTKMHAALADMYEADNRFAASIDAHGKGLTPFLSAAIRANATRS